MPGGPRQAIANIPKTFTESVVSPIVDQFGQAVEQGVNGVLGTPIKNGTQVNQPPKPVAQNPQQRSDEERRRQNILKYFDTLKANAQAYKQQQGENLQEKRQKEIEEKQKIQQFQFVEQKKKQRTDVYRAQRKAEIKVKGG